MKDGVFLVNCARIINETDIVAAVQSGKVGGCAGRLRDRAVPEIRHSQANIVMTPHSARTKEAQESVSIEVAEAITDFRQRA